MRVENSVVCYKSRFLLFYIFINQGLWENPWREKLVQLGFYDQPYYGPIIVFPIDDDGKRMNADDAFVSQFLDYEKTLSAEMTYIFDH